MLACSAAVISEGNTKMAALYENVHLRTQNTPALQANKFVVFSTFFLKHVFVNISDDTMDIPI